jgi:hypothetical protein
VAKGRQFQKVLEGIPEVSEYLVAGRRFPSCPDQRLFFCPLRGEALRQV